LIHPDVSRNWFSRLWPLLSRKKLLLTNLVIGAFVSISIQAMNPALLGFAVDSLSGEDPFQLELKHYALVLIVLGLIRAIIFIIYRSALAGMMYQLEADLRGIFFNHSTTLGLVFFDKMQTGQLISRANADIRALQLFMSFAPFMFITFIGFFAAIAYMLYTDVILTLLAVLALPGVYILGMRLHKLIFPLNWITQQRVADLTAIVDENLNGVRIVRTFTAEQRQIEKLALSALKLKWSNNKLVDTNAYFGPLMENIPRFGIAAVLYYGGLLVIEGEITVGALLAFNLYMLQLVTPFKMIGTFLMMERRAAASAQRIFEVLDSKAEIIDEADAKDLPIAKGDIEFNQVSFSYPTNPNVKLLKKLSFNIAAGETVALVGKTGSGKSTIAKLLMRLYEGDGDIRIDNVPIKTITLESLRQNIGIVLDEAFLFSSSIFDNIAFAKPSASLAEVMAAAEKAQAHEFINKLPDGYQTFVGERGYTLSGGQRQRIALARLFLQNPPILILDDSTSAIDVSIESKIYEALTRAMENRTTLIIAHRLSTINLAQRVLLFVDGEIVASGTHRELLANCPPYREVLAQEMKEENEHDKKSGEEIL